MNETFQFAPVLSNGLEGIAQCDTTHSEVFFALRELALIRPMECWQLGQSEEKGVLLIRNEV